MADSHCALKLCIYISLLSVYSKYIVYIYIYIYIERYLWPLFRSYVHISCAFKMVEMVIKHDIDTVTDRITNCVVHIMKE